MDRFVCVRMVQGWGMDLSLFQFDMDQTWAVFFLNADRILYGRYGTRSSREAVDDTLKGLKKAMRTALELHAGYPGNKEALAGKQCPKPAVAIPQEFPRFKGAAPATCKQDCIHCHMIHETEIMSLHQAGQPVPDKLLWAYPMPDLLGLSLDISERATVKAVAEDSEGAKAGFQPGDQIVRLEGEPILSIADVQWVLQNAAEPSSLKAEVDRGGKVQTLSLEVPAGWRKRGDFSWRTSSASLQWGALGGQTCMLNAEQRKELHLPPDRLALQITYMPEPDEDDPPPILIEDDVILEIDGKDAPVTMSQLMAFLYQTKKPGDHLALTVLRKGERKKVDYILP